MAFSPTFARQVEGEKVEAVTDFLFVGSKISVDRDCNHEIRRQLLLGRKAMTNLDNLLRSRDITLLKMSKELSLWSSQGSRMIVRAGP